MVKMVNTEQMHAAASMLERGWGAYGYRLGVEESFGRVAVFLCRASDGSEFRIVADSYGGARHVDADGGDTVESVVGEMIAELRELLGR